MDDEICVRKFLKIYIYQCWCSFAVTTIIITLFFIDKQNKSKEIKITNQMFDSLFQISFSLQSQENNKYNYSLTRMNSKITVKFNSQVI